MERFKDLAWVELGMKQYIIVVGAGGIGSHLVKNLSRLRPHKIIVYDFDKLELHNLSGQAYYKSQVGSYKIEALQLLCKEYSDYNINTNYDRWNQYKSIYPIVFSCVDNIKTRLELFNKWHSSYDTEDAIFIDGRLSAEQYQIYCVKGNDTPEHFNKFEESLTNNDAVEESCTMKQTTHYAALIAAEMTRFYTNWLYQRVGIPSIVPFYSELIGILNKHTYEL